MHSTFSAILSPLFLHFNNILTSKSVQLLSVLFLYPLNILPQQTPPPPSLCPSLIVTHKFHIPTKQHVKLRQIRCTF